MENKKAKFKKIMGYILLGLFIISFLIGLVAGSVTAALGYDGGIITISFVIPWLLSLNFVQTLWYHWRLNKAKH